MNRISFPLIIVLASASACVVDEQLGQPSEVDDSSSSGANSDDAPSTTETTESLPPPSDTETDTNSESGSESGSGAGMCPGWTPPDEACQPRSNATASVGLTEDPGGAHYEDEPCTVGPIVDQDAATTLFTLTCDVSLTFIVRTENPHVELPFAEGDVVLITTYNLWSMYYGAPATLTLHTPEGSLLLASVHQGSFDLDAFDIEPLQFGYRESGCPATDYPGFGSLLCDPGHEILQQRAMLDFSDLLHPGAPAVTLFDGQSANIGDAFTVIVEEAQKIVCHDEGCNEQYDDEVDSLEFLVVATPAE